MVIAQDMSEIEESLFYALYEYYSSYRSFQPVASKYGISLAELKQAYKRWANCPP